jgi:hypothetical protein
MTDVQRRAAEAATAAERLARSLSAGEQLDPITVAYLHRLGAAAEKASRYASYDLERVAPDPAYLGPLRHDPQTTASRSPE